MAFTRSRVRPPSGPPFFPACFSSRHHDVLGRVHFRYRSSVSADFEGLSVVCKHALQFGGIFRHGQGQHQKDSSFDGGQIVTRNVRAL